MFNQKSQMPGASTALPGRNITMEVTDRHYVNGNSIKDSIPEGMSQSMFGLGCFWGAERKFWGLDGVYSTAVGYAAGYTPNPLYEEVCSGMTAHNEVVLVFYDPEKIQYEDLLRCFWESHNATQGMRQGNDMGTQYRSGIYVYDDSQKQDAEESRKSYQQALTEASHGTITTEIIDAPEFYYAEDYHQQYLAKNPAGYCGIGGSGVNYK